MATSPDDTRAALTVVTAAAVAEVRQVADAAGESPTATRAALFAAVPLIVPEYGNAAGALALDWFEELREEAAPNRSFTPTLTLVTDDDLDAMIARTTRSLYEIEQGIRDDLEEALAEALAGIEAETQKAVATGFWDTTTDNVVADEDARGWQRFARPGACKFCLMCAERGGVYTRQTANFSAHTNCHCVARPCWDADAPEATAIQYIAAKRGRSAKERAQLREYLNQNFPDAPG